MYSTLLPIETIQHLGFRVFYITDFFLLRITKILREQNTQRREKEGEGETGEGKKGQMGGEEGN